MIDGLSFLPQFLLRMRVKGTPQMAVFGRLVGDEGATGDQYVNGVSRASVNSVHSVGFGNFYLRISSHTSEENERRTRPVPLLMACEVPWTPSTHISRTFLITFPWKLRSDERVEGGIEGSESKIDRSTRFAREYVEGARSAFNIH